MKGCVFLAGTGLLTLVLAAPGMAMNSLYDSMGEMYNSRPMSLKSNQVINGQPLPHQQLFNLWGCTGGNISPQLRWSNVPPGTKSFAVTLYDPDTPSGSGWWHWVVINIPGTTRQLPFNAGAQGGQNLPAGASMLRNDYGYKSYSGACPQPDANTHNYQITVYALDIPNLDIGTNSSPAMAGFYILQHALDKAVITAPTKRPSHRRPRSKSS